MWTNIIMDYLVSEDSPAALLIPTAAAAQLNIEADRLVSL